MKFLSFLFKCLQNQQHKCTYFDTKEMSLTEPPLKRIIAGLYESIINYPTVCLCVGVWVCDRTPPKRRLQS